MTDLLNVLVVGLLLGGIYSLVSIGLNLIFGVIRIVNFAQGEFVMLGMYGTFAAVTMSPYGSLCLPRPDAARPVPARRRRSALPSAASAERADDADFATFGLLILLQNIVLAMTRGASLSINAPISSLTVFRRADPGQPRAARYPGRRCPRRARARLVPAQHLAGPRHPRRRAGPARGAADGHRRRAHVHADLRHRRRARGPCRHALDADLYALAADRRKLHRRGFCRRRPRRARQRHRRLHRRLRRRLHRGDRRVLHRSGAEDAVWFSVFIVMLLVRPSGLFGHVGAEEVGLREQH